MKYERACGLHVCVGEEAEHQQHGAQPACAGVFRLLLEVHTYRTFFARSLALRWCSTSSSSMVGSRMWLSFTPSRVVATPPPCDSGTHGTRRDPTVVTSDVVGCFTWASTQMV